jgi:hypothetical protein
MGGDCMIPLLATVSLQEAGGSGGWTPADITTALWLDASDEDSITLNGSNVSQWDDKSGNNKHASQGTASVQPLYDEVNTLNGLPVLYIDDGYLTGAVVDESAVSIFAVRKCNNPGGSGSVYSNSIFDTADRLSFSSSDGIRFDNFNSDARFGVDGGFASEANTSTAWQIQCGTYENGDSARLYLDAVQVDTGNASGAIVTESSVYTIGRFLEDSSGTVDTKKADLFLAELIITPSVVTESVRQKIEGYLAWKWGLEANLPAAHPYKTAAP